MNYRIQRLMSTQTQTEELAQGPYMGCMTGILYGNEVLSPI